MVVNRLQDGLLNSCIALRASRLKKNQMGTHTFLEILRDFYSDKFPRVMKTVDIDQ
jgi:hypothetical protein